MLVPPAAGQAALSIQFAAPSPLELLTAVLAADRQPATAIVGAVGQGRH
jgi:hypothetical protein